MPGQILDCILWIKQTGLYSHTQVINRGQVWLTHWMKLLSSHSMLRRRLGPTIIPTVETSTSTMLTKNNW